MTFPSEVTERQRLCLTHGLVLRETDKGALICPKGHQVTKWAVSNPLTGKIEAQADADELGVEEVTLAERYQRGDAPRRGPARPRTEPPPSTPPTAWSAPPPPPAPTKSPEKVLAQRLTNGPESLNLKLMYHTAWGKPYRVTVSHFDGKARNAGVLRHSSTDPEGRREFEAAIKDAVEMGWIESAGRAGTLTAIPAPKAARK